MRLTAVDFDAWRHSPLTELIFDCFLQSEINVTKGQHDAEAWEGPLTADRHAAFRERCETLEFVRTLTFEQLDEWLQAEREEEPSHEDGEDV